MKPDVAGFEIFICLSEWLTHVDQSVFARRKSLVSSEGDPQRQRGLGAAEEYKKQHRFQGIENMVVLRYKEAAGPEGGISLCSL